MDYRIIIATCCFIVADLVSGFLSALYRGEWESSIMRKGLWHKLSELLMIMLAVGVEFAAPVVGLDVELPLVKGVCGALCVMELGSVIENIGLMNPQLTAILFKFFGQFKKDGEA